MSGIDMNQDESTLDRRLQHAAATRRMLETTSPARHRSTVSMESVGSGRSAGSGSGVQNPVLLSRRSTNTSDTQTIHIPQMPSDDQPPPPLIALHSSARSLSSASFANRSNSRLTIVTPVSPTSGNRLVVPPSPSVRSTGRKKSSSPSPSRPASIISSRSGRPPSVSERSQMSTAERLELVKSQAAAKKAAKRVEEVQKKARKAEASIGRPASSISISNKSKSSGSSKKKSSSKSKSKKSSVPVIHEVIPVPRSRVQLELDEAKLKAERAASGSPSRVLPKQPPLERVLSPASRRNHPPVSLNSPPPPTKEQQMIIDARERRNKLLLARAAERIKPPVTTTVAEPGSPRSKKTKLASPKNRARSLVQHQSPQQAENEALLAANISAREKVNKLKEQLERKQAALRKEWGMKEEEEKTPAIPILANPPIQSPASNITITPVPIHQAAHTSVATTHASPIALISTTGDVIEPSTVAVPPPRSHSPTLSPILKSSAAYHQHTGGGSDTDFTLELEEYSDSNQPEKKVAFSSEIDAHSAPTSPAWQIDRERPTQLTDDMPAPIASIGTAPATQPPLAMVVEEESSGLLSPASGTSESATKPTDTSNNAPAETTDTSQQVPIGDSSAVPAPPPLTVAPTMTTVPTAPVGSDSPRPSRKLFVANSSPPQTRRRNSISSVRSGGSGAEHPPSPKHQRQTTAQAAAAAGRARMEARRRGESLSPEGKKGGRYGASVDSSNPSHKRRSSTSSRVSSTSATSKASTKSSGSGGKKLKPRSSSKGRKSSDSDAASVVSSASSKRKKGGSKKKRKKGRTLSSSSAEFDVASSLLDGDENDKDELKRQARELANAPDTPEPDSPPPPPLTDEERVKLGFTHMVASARYSERLNDGLIDALQLYRNILLRRAMKKWREQFMMFRHQSFFYQWRELTRSRIAQKLYHFTLARRSLAHWILTARYSIGIPPLRARWNAMRRIELLKHMYERWRDAYFARFYAALNAYADKMFVFLQSRRGLRTWIKWNRSRQMTRKIAELKVKELRRQNWYIRWHQVINLRVHRQQQEHDSKRWDWKRVMGRVHKKWYMCLLDLQKERELVRLERKYWMSQALLLARHWRSRVEKTLDLRHNFDAVTNARMLAMKRRLFQQMWNWFCAIMYQRNRQLTVIRRKHVRRWMSRALHPDARAKRSMRQEADKMVQTRISWRMHDLVEHWIYYKNIQQHFRRQTEIGREWSDTRGALLAKAVWWSQWKRQIHRRYLGRTGITIHKQNRKWALYTWLMKWYDNFLIQLRKRQNYEAAAKLHKRSQLKCEQGALDRWWMAYEKLVRAPVNLVNLTRYFKYWKSLRDETFWQIHSFRRNTTLRKTFRNWYALFAQMRGVPNTLELRRRQREGMFDRGGNFGFGGGASAGGFAAGGGGSQFGSQFGGSFGGPMPLGGGAGGFGFQQQQPLGFHMPRAPQPRGASGGDLWSTGPMDGLSQAMQLNQPPIMGMQMHGPATGSLSARIQPPPPLVMNAPLMQQPIQQEVIREESELESMLLESVLPVVEEPAKDEKFTFYDPQRQEKAQLQRQGSWRGSQASSGRSTPTGGASGNLGSKRFATVVIPEEKIDQRSGGSQSGRTPSGSPPPTGSPQSNDHPPLSASHRRGPGSVSGASAKGSETPPHWSHSTSIKPPPPVQAPDADKFLPSAADAEWQWQQDFSRGLAALERQEPVRTITGSFARKIPKRPPPDEWERLDSGDVTIEGAETRDTTTPGADDSIIDWEHELNPLAVETEETINQSHFLIDESMHRDEFDLEVSRQERQARKEKLDAKRKKEEDAARLEAEEKAAKEEKRNKARARREAEQRQANESNAATADVTPAITLESKSVGRHARTVSEPAVRSPRSAGTEESSTFDARNIPVNKAVSTSGTAPTQEKPLSKSQSRRGSTSSSISAQFKHSVSSSPARRSSVTGASPDASIAALDESVASISRRVSSPEVRISFLSDSFEKDAEPIPVGLASPLPEMTLDDLIIKTPPRSARVRSGSVPRAGSNREGVKLFGSPRQMAKALTRQYNTSHPSRAGVVVQPGLKHVTSLLGFKYVAPPNLQIQHPSEIKPPLPLAAQAKSRKLQQEKDRRARLEMQEQARQLRELERANHIARMRDALGPAAELYPLEKLELGGSVRERPRGRSPGRSSKSTGKSPSRSRSARRGRSSSNERSAWLRTHGDDPTTTTSGGGTRSTTTTPIPIDDTPPTLRSRSQSRSGSGKKKAVAWSITVPGEDGSGPLQPLLLNNLANGPHRPPTRPRSASTSRSSSIKLTSNSQSQVKSRSRSPSSSLRRTGPARRAPPSLHPQQRPTMFKPALPHFAQPTRHTAEEREQKQLAKVEQAWQELVTQQAVAKQAEIDEARKSAPPPFPTLIPSFPIFVAPTGRTTVPRPQTFPSEIPPPPIPGFSGALTVAATIAQEIHKQQQEEAFFRPHFANRPSIGILNRK